MKTEQKIYKGIQEALKNGQSVVSLSEAVDVDEASNLTGSGSGVGGRIYFDDATAALRYANPFRMGSRQIIAKGSDVSFVAKTGNATNQTNPFGYTFTPNSGTPDTDTAYWQIPMRVITAQLPIRSAVLSDVNGLEQAVVNDLMLEFSAVEAASMALNDDQTGSTTTSTGGVNGLRGLAYYNTSTTAADYGTSGTAISDGIHTVLKEEFSATAITYDDMVNAVNLLPAQYWSLPTTAWHLHPKLIQQLRKLKGSTGGAPMFVEVGDEDGGAGAFIFGFPVIPNPYLDEPGVGKLSGVLANWDRFLTIADGEEMTIKMFDQTAPGFVTLWAEKRMVSTVRDPFAGVYLIGA